MLELVLLLNKILKSPNFLYFLRKIYPCMIEKQFCKWICILFISLSIAMINVIEELKEMINTVKKLQQNVFIRILIAISPIIYFEEILFWGLISEV